MRIVDKYKNLPDADIANRKNATQKYIDPVYKIPEDRINEQCIVAVAKKLGVGKDIVRQIHDFQWAKVKEATDTFRLIHVSKFFKLRLVEHKALAYIEEMKKDIAYIDERLEGTIRAPRRREFEEKRIVLTEKIKVLEVQLTKCTQNKKKK